MTAGGAPTLLPHHVPVSGDSLLQEVEQRLATGRPVALRILRYQLLPEGDGAVPRFL